MFSTVPFCQGDCGSSEPWIDTEAGLKMTPGRELRAAVEGVDRRACAGRPANPAITVSITGFDCLSPKRQPPVRSIPQPWRHRLPSTGATGTGDPAPRRCAWPPRRRTLATPFVGLRGATGATVLLTLGDAQLFAGRPVAPSCNTGDHLDPANVVVRHKHVSSTGLNLLVPSRDCCAIPCRAADSTVLPDLLDQSPRRRADRHW